MKHVVKIFFTVTSIVFVIYLCFPSPEFPPPPPDSIQSDEPADTETVFRRAYFTNSSREEVISHYKDQFKKSMIFGISYPTYRLNYPPEEAQTKIRDQTRSSYLEEIVHPFRESFFINGFLPGSEKDTIHIKGQYWKQKITVRYITSDFWQRLFIGLLIIVVTIIIKRKFSDIVLHPRS